MSTLRHMAEQAANKAQGCRGKEDGCDNPICTDRRAAVADAIERVARAFAERVAYDAIQRFQAGGDPLWHRCVAEAIAAAEKGEP